MNRGWGQFETAKKPFHTSNVSSGARNTSPKSEKSFMVPCDFITLRQKKLKKLTVAIYGIERGEGWEEGRKGRKERRKEGR